MDYYYYYRMIYEYPICIYHYFIGYYLDYGLYLQLILGVVIFKLRVGCLMLARRLFDIDQSIFII